MNPDIERQIAQLEKPKTSVSYRLPFPPSVNGAYRIFKSQKGTTIRAKGTAHERWVTKAGAEILAQRRFQGSIIGRYRLTITLERKSDKNRRDLGNYEKAISDVLVSMRVVQDDSFSEEIIMRWGNVSGAHVLVESVPHDGIEAEVV